MREAKPILTMRASFKLIRLFLVLFAAMAASVAVRAGDPSGTWTFKASANGERAVESTLSLKWDGRRLTGSIDNRAGKAEIVDATFVNDEVKFTVKREFGRRLRKRTITVHYSGKLEGDAITGTIETKGRDKKPVSVAWAAQRVK